MSRFIRKDVVTQRARYGTLAELIAEKAKPERRNGMQASGRMSWKCSVQADHASCAMRNCTCPCHKFSLK